MNTFIRSHKILQIENELIKSKQSAWWCFCIKYLNQEQAASPRKVKFDYKQELDENTFSRFSVFREIRKKIAKEEAIPAYAIFIDKELAKLAQFEVLTLDKMKSIKGIGERKIQKYGKYFLTKPEL